MLKFFLLHLDDDGLTQQTYGPTVGQGDYRFIDQNNDGQINEEDKVKIGSPYPDFTLGLNNDFTYKGFDLNIFSIGTTAMKYSIQ